MPDIPINQHRDKINEKHFSIKQNKDKGQIWPYFMKGRLYRKTQNDFQREGPVFAFLFSSKKAFFLHISIFPFPVQIATLSPFRFSNFGANVATQIGPCVATSLTQFRLSVASNTSCGSIHSLASSLIWMPGEHPQDPLCRRQCYHSIFTKFAVADTRGRICIGEKRKFSS